MHDGDIDDMLEDGDLDELRDELACCEHQRQQTNYEQEILAQQYHIAECEFVAAKIRYKKEIADIEHRRVAIDAVIDKLRLAIRDREVAQSAKGEGVYEDDDVQEGEY